MYVNIYIYIYVKIKKSVGTGGAEAAGRGVWQPGRGNSAARCHGLRGEAGQAGHRGGGCHPASHA